MTLFLSLFMACKDQATIDENSTLKTRVADLERTKERLEKDNEALKIQLDKAKAAPATPAGGETPAAPAADLPGKVTFKTTLGDIHCTLRTTQTPETIANFVGLATGKKEWTDPRTNQKSSAPLYDGTIFHRVIPGFMAQGGDPLGNGTGGPGYTFADEVGDFTKFDKPGLLAMANRGPNTNGSQFFITDGTPTHLNRKHTIFGDCKDLDVVKKITNAKTGERDKPETDIVLQKVILGS